MSRLTYSKITQAVRGWKSRLLLGAALLTVIAIWRLLPQITGGKSTSSASLSGDSHTVFSDPTLPKENQPYKKPRSETDKTSLPQPQTGRAVDPEVQRASKALKDVLRGFEMKRAELFWKGKADTSEMLIFSIHEPKAEEIGAVSQAMTAILESVNPSSRTEARKLLQFLYNDYLKYEMPYRVLYARKVGNSDSFSISETNARELNDEVLPGEAGSIRLSGHSTQSFFTVGQDPERHRYGYLFDAKAK